MKIPMVTQATAIPKSLTLLLVFAALLVAMTWRLPALVVSDADEGTYVYAGRLVTEGRMPYRDFLYAHPPGMIGFTALAWTLGGGSLFGVRLFFVLLCLLCLFPMTFLVERFSRSWIGGVVAGELLTVGLLLMANMGRTARLEPVMVVLLVWGLAGWLLAPRSRLVQALAGAAFAAAILVKLTAVVPVGSFLIGQLVWQRGESRRWAWAALGALAIGCPLLVILVREPAFREWALVAQALRPPDRLAWRLSTLGMALVRCPMLALGLVASAAVLVRGGSPFLRSVALAGVATTLCLVFAFRSVATYYFALPLPLAILILAVEAESCLRPRWGRLLERGWLVLAIALPFVALAFSETYHRRATSHVAEPRAMLPALQSRAGPIWTSFPDFALYVGRPLVDWYFVVDSYLPRQVGRLSESQLDASLAQAETIVLRPRELDRYPNAKRTMVRDFVLAHAGPNWFLWNRRRCVSAVPE